MNTHPSLASQRQALKVALVIALVFGAYFLRHYFGLIVVASIAVFLFNPIYDWVLKKTKRPGLSAMLTFLSALLVIIIPVVAALGLMVVQVEAIGRSVQSQVQGVDLGLLGQQAMDSVNNVLASIPGVSFRLTPEVVGENITRAFEAIANGLVHALGSSVGGVAQFVTTLVVFVFVFFALLTNQKVLIDKAKALNPLGPRSSELYLGRIAAMTKAVVRGQFIIAFLQGVASAGILAIAGLGDLFFFFAVLLTLLSIIPLGAGIITIPIGIIMIFTGNVWQGVMIIAAHLIVITNIDNFLRPYLVPKEARLNPALMIISVFAGLSMFGFLGIVIGPVIMILIVTTIQMYLETMSPKG